MNKVDNNSNKNNDNNKVRIIKQKFKKNLSTYKNAYDNIHWQCRNLMINTSFKKGDHSLLNLYI